MLWMAKYVFYINFNCTFRYPEMEKHFECQPESVVTPLFMKLILELAGRTEKAQRDSFMWQRYNDNAPMKQLNVDKLPCGKR